ncbi:MAG: ATP-binding cassette domain-containing protein [Planctomycetia bacterium]|nr:ATP-binding cassette domain-containing protein [Planctomycetia bacterium]
MARQNTDQTFSLDKLPDWSCGWLNVFGARHNNLKAIDVAFPLSAFTAVTGVSGSGKSSLVEDVLYRALAKQLHRAQTEPGLHDRIVGLEQINKVIEVDQKPIGLTPTSNPATYTGVFDLIRQLFAKLPDSKLRGYTPRRFSFNAPGGRCEKCQGAGQLNIEMHFLADVWITCDECGGLRYEPQTLEIRYRGKSIADVLNMSCKDALTLFANVPGIARILRTLCDVGLDYIALGQSATTLSGGEAQRVKLATELSRPDTGRTLYILDEPTTGLHFEDLKKLLDVLQRLVDLGNTVVVIEHNPDLIKSVDWVVELGPEAGLAGGYLVFQGTPEQLIDYEVRREALPARQQGTLPISHTALALRPILESGHYEDRPLFDAKHYAEELRRSIEQPDLPDNALSGEDSQMPWESNGRLWHTRNRLSRSGAPCQWDGRILEEVVDRIASSEGFSEIDWNNRTIVEIRASRKSLGWFLHAITGEEWLLKLKFRVPKNTFRKELLIQQLNLRPLNEMDDIPLYGTQPRVKVETTGLWQEVELKICKYEEADRPEFRNFLDLAISQFSQFMARAKEKDVDLTPWRTQGQKWHLSPGHCYGGSSKAQWPLELLEKLFNLLDEVFPEAVANWSNKVLVPYTLEKGKRTLFQVYTKNCEFVCLQLNVAKNAVPLGRILALGRDAEVDGSHADSDAVYLRFSEWAHFDVAALKTFLREIREQILREL